MFWKRLKEVLKLRDYMKNDDEILKKAWEQHLHISNKIRETYDTEGINDLVLKAIALADERAREDEEMLVEDTIKITKAKGTR